MPGNERRGRGEEHKDMKSGGHMINASNENKTKTACE